MGPSWGPLGPSWAPLGPSWGPLGPSWGSLGGVLGRFGAVLGASWAVLERPEAEKARTQKTSEKLMKINDFGFLGPSSEASWKALGASWASPRPKIRERPNLSNVNGERLHLLAFGPSLRRAWAAGQKPLECSLGSRGRPLGGLVEAVLKPLGSRFGASWGLFWASWGPLGASWGSLGASWGPLGAES